MKKYTIVIVLTLLASIAVFRVHHAESLKNEKLFSFPLKIGEWSGQEIATEGWVLEALKTPYVILRDYYSTNGEAVNLFIAWYDDREIGFHMPEACLGGLGNRVKKKSVCQVKMDRNQSYPVTKLLVERDSERSLVFYYFINDGYVTPSLIDVRIKCLLRRLQLKRTSVALVRFMFPIKRSQAHTRILLEGFLKATFPAVLEHTDSQRAL